MRQRQFDIIGWTLFAVGCVAFVVQGVMTGSMLTLVGSVLFLVGVVVVLVPYYFNGKEG